MLPSKGVFFIFVVVLWKVNGDADRGTKKYEGTEAEARQDLDDNVADSSVMSYSNVVIHHTSAKPGLEHEENEPSKSESYFKIYNSHGKRNNDENFRHQERPVRHEEAIKHEEPKIEITRTEKPKLRYQSSTERTPKYRSRNEDKSQKFQPYEEKSPKFQSYEEKSPKFQSYEEKSPKFQSYEEKSPKFQSYEEKRPKFQTSYEDSRSHHSFVKHEAPEHRGHDYRTESSKNYKPKAPPGMSEELMETLLQQEPQKFNDGEKVKRYEPKKVKSPREHDSFNVGYSIGFGQPSEDVVLGRPKNVKLHVNGEKSYWKQLNEGIEMSHEVNKKKPLSYRIPDSSTRGASPQINVLKNGGSSVFYMNNNSPDINNIPTEGKGSFDHNRALTYSNSFDFSNAMTSAPVPEAFSPKPKAKGIDLGSFYQSMGFAPPIPVFIPDSKGDGQMIHAIVIPLQTLPNVDFNWGNLGAYNAPNFNFNPNTQYHGNHFVKEKPRSPKSHRSPKDSAKSASSFSSSPIVVAPMRDLQKEQAALNAILAKELSRKNHRQPLGLRPPLLI